MLRNIKILRGIKQGGGVRGRRAYCVPEQCTATVRCELLVNIVCHNSARQQLLCAVNLWRTWPGTVRDNCAL